MVNQYAKKYVSFMSFLGKIIKFIFRGGGQDTSQTPQNIKWIVMPQIWCPRLKVQRIKSIVLINICLNHLKVY